MRNRLIWKIFGAFVLLILAAVFVLNFFVSLTLRQSFEERITEKLRTNAMLAGQIFKKNMQAGDVGALQVKVEAMAKELQLRITLIDKDGAVLADSERDPAVMASHADRYEIIQTLKSPEGFGQSTRFSETMNYDMKYVAVRVGEGEDSLGVVRFALPLSEVQLEIRQVYKPVLFGGMFTVAIALIGAYYVSRGISKPIKQMEQTAERMSRGDFGERIKVSSADELGQLANAFNSMADELQAKIENLKKMDRVRTDFVANVSHELKTPLTSIKGFVETMQDGALDNPEKARRFLSIIDKHVRRLENIISDLLTLSEMETHPGYLHKSEFDLKELIDEVTLGFGHALAAKRQRLEINRDSTNFSISADRDRVEQVFVNLIDNAIKYSPEGADIRIVLTEEKDRLTGAVEDNGVGIAPRDIERVFERFYRVDKARSRELGGTGLGLSIAKHIVLAHRGAIRIESEPAKGTRVLVTLPRK